MAGRQEDKDDSRVYGQITVTIPVGAADPCRMVIDSFGVLEERGDCGGQCRCYIFKAWTVVMRRKALRR